MAPLIPSTFCFTPETFPYCLPICLTGLSAEKSTTMALAETRIRLKDRVDRWLPETMTGVKEGFLAIMLFILTQLIICGIQEILDRLPLDFSAPIISMTLVFAATLLIGWAFTFEATDAVYRRHLKAPVGSPCCA